MAAARALSRCCATGAKHRCLRNCQPLRQGADECPVYVGTGHPLCAKCGRSPAVCQMGQMTPSSPSRNGSGSIYLVSFLFTENGDSERSSCYSNSAKGARWPKRGPGRSAAALASNANEGARWVHQRIAQRSLLARRTPTRPHPDHRVARRPRGHCSSLWRPHRPHQVRPSAAAISSPISSNSIGFLVPGPANPPSRWSS